MLTRLKLPEQIGLAQGLTAEHQQGIKVSTQQGLFVKQHVQDSAWLVGRHAGSYTVTCVACWCLVADMQLLMGYLVQVCAAVRGRAAA